jgi:tRNA(His) guanylyltransferase
MSKDPMGERMKFFERSETSRKCEPHKPICVRLDGRSFSTFTRGLRRPYDGRLSRLMIETTKHLVGKTHAVIGYTQSDEITLIYSYGDLAQPLFGGKYHKLTSILASEATAAFNDMLSDYLPEKEGARPTFDCRVFQVFDEKEAANVLLWRWFDAKKNSVAMLAQSVFSTNQLKYVSCDTMHKMLKDKDISWKDKPDFFKWGTFVRRGQFELPLTDEELKRIPKTYRPAPGTTKARILTTEVEMPPFIDVTNRIDFIFKGDEPRVDPYFHEPTDVSRVVKAYGAVKHCARRVACFLHERQLIGRLSLPPEVTNIGVEGITITSGATYLFPLKFLAMSGDDILRETNLIKILDD